MPDEKRIVDHAPMIAAGRVDAGREGARIVQMTVGELWRLIHQVPSITSGDRSTVEGGLKARALPEPIGLGVVL